MKNTVNIKVVNPQGQAQMFFGVTTDYREGYEHITLRDGTSFKVSYAEGWKIIIL